jgi:uncharacterized protein (DUF1800 family)
MAGSSAITPQRTAGPPVAEHTGPHPDDPTLPAPDPLHTLLSRCCYGIRQSEWDHAVALDYTGWLAEQLDPLALDDSLVESQVAVFWPRTTMDAAQLLTDVQLNGNPQRAAAELRGASLHRQLHSPRQLFETLVEFWGDHFNIATTGSPEAFYKVVDDREVIRAHALGRFRDMLHASARSLAMLHYLDNVSNRAAGPNENYARELMELHTLGLDGGYTEQDVAEVARCFTGWTVVGAAQGSPAFGFLPSRHDTGAKTVLGTAIAAGGGIEDGIAVLDLLASHPATAQHLASKLCRRFIGDSPQATAVDAVAASFIASDGHLPTVMNTLLGSAEFISSYDRKVRRPIDYLLACLRATDAALGGAYPNTLQTRLTTLGQLPFRWATPDGYPDAMDDWVNSGAMLTRWNAAFAIVENRAPGVAVDMAGLLAGANTPATIVARLQDRLLHRALSEADAGAMLTFCADGGSVDRVLSAVEADARGRELAGLLLSSPYFNYR